MKKWQCSVCGYIHEGEQPPDICPVCGVGKEEFELLEETQPDTGAGDIRRILVIGNGAAGIEAARSARRVSPDADIHVFAKESYPFYSRLFLTPYLANQKKREQLFVYKQEWFDSNRINQHLGETVNTIIPAERKILTSKDDYIYDRLILCNGATPFNPYSNQQKTGMFTLRSLDDANRILDYSRSAKNVVVVGGGILGLETSGALVQKNIHVDVLELSKTLMPRQLDQSGAEIMTKILENKGITVHNNAEVAEILGDQKATGVRLTSGVEIKADLVIVSIGITPDVQLAKQAGLGVNRGVVVDNLLRTSDPNIYAAGDVAEHNKRIYGLWFACVEQGKIAGQNAAGAEVVYDGTVPVSVLKVIGTELTSLGRFNKKEETEQEIRSPLPNDNNYKKLLLQDNQIIGAIIFGNNQLGSAIEMIMRKKKQLTSDIISSIRNNNWDSLVDFSRV